jgi:antitoxin component YwqK of YwqJK toxin-antitoxin module
MRKIAFIFTFLFCLLSFSTKAQSTIYFDANWNVTTKDNAVYYRSISSKKTKQEWIIDYYISGKKAKEVATIKGKEEGKFSMYYESGELMTDGRYKDGEKDGIWKTYYKNGKIKIIHRKSIFEWLSLKVSAFDAH